MHNFTHRASSYPRNRENHVFDIPGGIRVHLEITKYGQIRKNTYISHYVTYALPLM